MNEAEKRLDQSCGDEKSIFYRTFVVGKDGRVDIVVVDNHSEPNCQIKGLRSGLWRTFKRYEEGCRGASAVWAIWLWDGSSSKELLLQMAGEEQIGEAMRKTIQLKVQPEYALSLAWQQTEDNDTGLHEIHADDGLALRTRHLFSDEFYSFLHGKSIDGEEEAAQWHQTLARWFGGDNIEGNDDTTGYMIGGAVLRQGSEFNSSCVKDETDRIIGFLFGSMVGEESDQDSIEKEYDLMGHEEALEEATKHEHLKPIVLTCVHGGDPGLEDQTPNYLPSFQITLKVEDLLADTATLTADYIMQYLIEHQNQLFNPYIDLTHSINGECSKKCQGMHSEPPLVTLDATASFWANLRTQTSSGAPSAVFHLPHMHHIAQNASPLSSFRPNEITDCVAPSGWYDPPACTLCPPDQYKTRPIFEYVGCGYALTPTSSYPRVKARQIRQWIPPQMDDYPRPENLIDDPYKAHYMMGLQAKDAVEVLGHTAILTTEDGQQRYFADIFGYDPTRGFLFGWLRLPFTGGVGIEPFCAFSLPVQVLKEPSLPSLPPLKIIQVDTFGFPQTIPMPIPSQRRSVVPIEFRQRPTNTSPNILPDVELHFSTDQFSDRPRWTWGLTVYQALLEHIIEHQLFHPLYIQMVQNLLQEEDAIGIINSTGGDQFWSAFGSCMKRGQAPGQFGMVIEWGLGSKVDQYNWRRYRELPIPSLRQQPQFGMWIAPSSWYEPPRPFVDSLGSYQKIDVMSYIGCGHILPPWSDYPPKKARHVWSRVSLGDNNSDGQEKTNVLNEQIALAAPYTPATSLIEVLGQTVIARENDWNVFAADIFGVDESRGLAFGFSRLHAFDTFVCFEVESLIKRQSGQSESVLPNPAIQPHHCISIGLPYL